MFNPLRFSLRLALTSAVVWTLGVLALVTVALSTSWQAGETALDQQLKMHAWAMYGLAWFDVDGVFHDEVVRNETELLANGLDVYVVTADRVVFAGPYNQYQIDDLPRLATEVMQSESDKEISGTDKRGAAFRALATPTYDDADNVVAAIVVLADPTPTNAAWWSFASKIGVASGLLILLGIGYSGVLAQRTLRPLERSIRDRQQVLAAAAHELRTPMATLQAIVDAAGDESAEQALVRVGEVVAETSEMVDRLLTWSRLSEGQITVEPLRFDLLVDALLNEELADLEPSIVIGDPGLLRMAVGNLLDNARTHGGGIKQIILRDGRLQIIDFGNGFPDLANLIDPFVRGPDSTGTGLGLALVDQIAQLHNGRFKYGPGPSVEIGLPIQH